MFHVDLHDVNEMAEEVVNSDYLVAVVSLNKARM